MDQGGRTPRGLRAKEVTLGEGRYLLVSFPRQNAAPSLTAAEEAVALAILTGRSNSDIARSRGTSPRTVANQVASLFRKLGVRSRTELAATWRGE